MPLKKRIHQLHPLDEALHVLHLEYNVLAQNCGKLDRVKARVRCNPLVDRKLTKTWREYVRVLARLR
jgi:hypothetical protein